MSPVWKAGAWESQLHRNEDGNVKKLLANVMTVLSGDPAWRGVLAYDAFRQTIVKLREPPVREQDRGSSEGSDDGWSEGDTARACTWMATAWGFEPSTRMMEQAIKVAAERNIVHPVRDYLAGLKWDRQERISDMFATYFGCENSDYTRAVGSRWPTGAIARVMNPGCQVDSMIVLEGAQGIGKSRGMRAFVGDAWFSDTSISIGDKDSYQALRGKWVHEFAELDSLKGREATRVKSFLSSPCDTYRPSYGCRAIDHPRQWVSFGTTNEKEYLPDPTGGRRFWPLRCRKRIDVAGLRRDRDQLWAEAYHRYQHGECWHLDTSELRGFAEAEQRARQVVDPWQQLIEAWLSANPRTNSSGVTTGEVLREALELKPRDMNRAAETRAGTAMRALGWEPKRDATKGDDGKRARRYYPESEGEDEGAETSSADQAASPLGWPEKALANTHASPPIPTLPTSNLLSQRDESAQGEALQQLSAESGFEVGLVGRIGRDSSADACKAVGRVGPLDQQQWELGTVVRTGAERAALVAYLARHPSELERLGIEGRPAERVSGPVLAADVAAWYRDHPAALERDARALSEAS